VIKNGNTCGQTQRSLETHAAGYSQKDNLPVTKNVLLKDGKVAATNLDAWAVYELPEVEGECLLPHKQVSELLKYVPGDDTLTLEKKNGSLQLSWADGKAAYEVAKAEDYPPLPEVKFKVEADVDGSVLVKGLTSWLLMRPPRGAGQCSTALLSILERNRRSPRRMASESAARN